MPPADPRRPLTRAEQNRVHRLLARAAGSVRSFEALDGLFAALLSGPELVLPSEFLTDMFGDSAGASPFKSMKEAQAVLDLLMRHWNGVAQALAEDNPFVPAVAATSETGAAGRDWAVGYRLGIRARARSWRSLTQDPVQGQYLRSILALAGEPETPPKLELRLELETGQPPWHEVHLATLGANVTQVYRQLEPERRRAAGPEPYRGKRTVRGARTPADDPTAAGPAERWEVGLIPVPGVIENDPRARPVAVIIASGEGQIVHMEVVGHPPADEAAMAALVAREVVGARSKLGASPLLWVRDAVIANALRKVPQLKRARVEVRDTLPMLDDVARSLAEEFAGARAPGSLAHSGTWAGWGLADATISALFAAAARYYRAAPWAHFDDDPPFQLEWPDGDRWAASVLGAAGQQEGLALFLDPDDFEALMEADGDELMGLAAVRGMTISVVFSSQTEIERPARKEIQAHGWEVAGPEAYPELMVINSPTAGISERLATRATQALAALAGLAAEGTGARRPGRRKRRTGVSWRDPETGLTVRREEG